MINKEYFEKRKVIELQNESISQNYFEDGVYLNDIVFKYDKILLLGNPGIGKTKELQELFSFMWAQKSITSWVPILINLRNFRKTDKFEDLIVFNEWKSLPNIIFILDGLDEIADIEDFISALSLFMIINVNYKIKYILSCRSNIYSKYSLSLSKFKLFSLNPFTIEQIQNLLLKGYGIEKDKLTINNENISILSSPFFLNIIAGYITQNIRIPENMAQFWELYIKENLNNCKGKFAKKLDKFNIQQFKDDSTKLGFINEISQLNYNSDVEIFRLVGNRNEDFILLPYIQLSNYYNDRYHFEHKQIQEYFAAQFLLNRTLDEIKNILIIPNTQAGLIKPTISNVVTFLINLIDPKGALFKELIEWLLKNNFEVLFRSDSNRLNPEIRKSAFQNYFNQTCLLKQFWISNNKTYSVEDIARFADSDENLIYLLDFIINSKKYHFRVVISALEVVGRFKNISKNNKVELKDKLLAFIKADHDVYENIDSVKSYALRCMLEQEFHLDKNYRADIFQLFENETNAEINVVLLRFIDIENVADVHANFEYIFREFKRAHNIERRLNEDKVIRGNKMFVELLLFKVSKEKYWQKVINCYLDPNNNIRIDNELALKLINKCNEFKPNKNLILNIFHELKTEKITYHNDKMLEKLVLDFACELEVTELILEMTNPNNVHNALDFITEIANKEVVKLIAKKIKLDLINVNIIHTRNRLYYKSNELGMYFVQLMNENGFELELITPKLSAEDYQKEVNRRNQENLELLFNKKLLFEKIELVFTSLNVAEITRDQITKINKDDWELESNFGVTTIEKSIIRDMVFRSGGIIKKESLFKHLEANENLILYNAVYEIISANHTIDLTKKQIQEVKEWCQLVTETRKNDHVAKYNADGSITPYKKLEIITLIIKFDKKFDLHLPQSFYLNCIEFIALIEDNNKEQITWYMTKVNDVELFHKKITEIITKTEPKCFNIDILIEYSIENKLEATYPIIEKLVKENKLVLKSNFLEEFIINTKNFALLVDCCSDINSFSCWSAIKILVSNDKEAEFCSGKAVEYLQQNLVQDAYHAESALAALFKLNRPEVFDYYLKFIKSGKDINERSLSLQKFNTYKDNTIIKKLFYAIYDSNLDSFRLFSHSQIFAKYIWNLSADGPRYRDVQKVFDDIKSELDTRNESKKDSLIFHINQLIENSNNSFFQAQSKPLSFDEALQYVNSLP